jgi:hypothetical protein
MGPSVILVYATVLDVLATLQGPFFQGWEDHTFNKSWNSFPKELTSGWHNFELLKQSFIKQMSYNLCNQRQRRTNLSKRVCFPADGILSRKQSPAKPIAGCKGWQNSCRGLQWHSALSKALCWFGWGMTFFFNLDAKQVALCAFLPRPRKPGGIELFSKLS